MATPTVKAPTTIPQDLQEKIIALAVLRAQILSCGRTYRKLREEITARLAAEVRS